MGISPKIDGNAGKRKAELDGGPSSLKRRRATPGSQGRKRARVKRTNEIGNSHDGVFSSVCEFSAASSSLEPFGGLGGLLGSSSKRRILQSDENPHQQRGLHLSNSEQGSSLARRRLAAEEELRAHFADARKRRGVCGNEIPTQKPRKTAACARVGFALPLLL